MRHSRCAGGEVLFHFSRLQGSHTSHSRIETGARTQRPPLNRGGEVRMPEESPGKPAAADGLGTNGNVHDAEMRDSTERTAAADAAAKEEAIKLAAEAAAREEEMRQEGLRREMEARRQAEERARAERERAQEWVLVSLMTIGTLQEAQQLIVEVGLVSPDRLSRLAWMEARERLGRAGCRSAPGSSTSGKATTWSRPWQQLLVMRMCGRKTARCGSSVRPCVGDRAVRGRRQRGREEPHQLGRQVRSPLSGALRASAVRQGCQGKRMRKRRARVSHAWT